jgi:deoxyribose-phosphate aldolase
MIDFHNPHEVAGAIDQTLLQPTATHEQVELFCRESATLGFASVCLAPYWLHLASRAVADSKVRLCTVVGFPLGFDTLEVKVLSGQAVLDGGAEEIDYVVNMGAVKSRDYEFVAAEMAAMRRVAEKAILKVILETGYLTDQEKKDVCRLAVDAGLDFVKTSTGFGPTGGSVVDVALLNECGQGKIKVKAAGGIRTIHDLRKMILAGAHRIGTSAGKEILAQIEASQEG